MTKEAIIKAIKEASGAKEIELEFPENEAHGDYTTNVALKLKESGPKEGNPREVAEKIVVKLKGNPTAKKLFENIEVAGPGFINFRLKDAVLIDNLREIIKQKEKYGTSRTGAAKTVVIDYSSPNIAKTFGVGHLRSTIIGAALNSLYKALGYEVVGDNHLGDWGTQFGALLYQIDSQKLSLASLSVEKLEDLYIDFHKKAKENPELEDEARKWFKKLEEGEAKAKKVWQECVDVSMKEFDRIYNLLGVKIDFAFGESYYESEMKQLLADARVQRFLTDGEDGAKIIDLTQFGITTPIMVLKKDGATTYATRDLATIRFRVRKWDPDVIIYEVGAEQTLHFKQLFAAAKLLKLIDPKVALIHTAHGLYLAPDGKKFSTRQGKTIKLDEVLKEAIERAKKLGNKNEKLAQEVGIGAIKYYDLMHSLSSNVIFSWEKIMNLEGNSGPYLQYTVARINSVLAKSKKSGLKEKTLQESTNLDASEASILRALYKFGEIIEQSAIGFSPNILCNYLYDLAQKFNSFYNGDRIIGSDNEDFRLALTLGTGQVLKNGLKILGISTPAKM
ncbi:MAG TPA: arginine--tRNA ligase [Patescibacteria group bacterium]|nr:arginine--tRNA ligase [Patescibacteria group bacterium]